MRPFISAMLLVTITSIFSSCSSSNNITLSEDKPLTLYKDIRGIYYTDDSNQRHYIEFAENYSSKDESYETENEDSHITGSYDNGIISFSIADGCYVEDSDGMAMLRYSGDNNYDDYIAVVPSISITEETFTDINKETINDIYKSSVAGGIYSNYIFIDENEQTVSNVEAKVYNISYMYRSLAYNCEYIFINSDVPYAIISCRLKEDKTEELAAYALTAIIDSVCFS